MALIPLILLIISEVCSLAILVLETIHHFWKIPTLSNDTIGFLDIIRAILSCIVFGILLPLYLKMKKKAKQDSHHIEKSS